MVSAPVNWFLSGRGYGGIVRHRIAASVRLAPEGELGCAAGVSSRGSRGSGSDAAA